MLCVALLFARFRLLSAIFVAGFRLALVVVWAFCFHALALCGSIHFHPEPFCLRQCDGMLYECFWHAFFWNASLRFSSVDDSVRKDWADLFAELCATQIRCFMHGQHLRILDLVNRATKDQLTGLHGVVQVWQHV